MRIRLLPTGEVLLEEADDFRRFSVLVPPGTAPTDSALAGLMLVEGGHAWVSPAALRELHPAADAGWRRELDAMVRFAADKGWTDGEGRVRAHIEEA